MAAEINGDLKVDTIKDKAGTGAPNFPNNLQINGQELVYECDDLDISSSGDFDSGQAGNLIRVDKVGRVVTISWTAQTHTNGTTAETAVGFIPAAFRPVDTFANVYNKTGSVVYSLVVLADGQMSFRYHDWAGAGSSQTGVSAGTISFPAS